MKSKMEKFSVLKYTPKSANLSELCEKIDENLKFFKNTEIFLILEKIYWLVENSEKLSVELEVAAHECDFDTNSAGNGFWAFIHCFNTASEILMKICKKLSTNREKVLTKKKFYVK
jgi:hypothetical protein